MLDAVLRCNCLLRFNKFLLYFGYSVAAARDVKVGVFCKTLSDFALEYRTTRDRVVHQRQKKATQRQRNMTRGKMIVEVSRAMCYVVDVSCRRWSGVAVVRSIDVAVTDVSDAVLLSVTDGELCQEVISTATRWSVGRCGGWRCVGEVSAPVNWCVT